MRYLGNFSFVWVCHEYLVTSYQKTTATLKFRYWTPFEPPFIVLEYINYTLSPTYSFCKRVKIEVLGTMMPVCKPQAVWIWCVLCLKQKKKQNKRTFQIFSRLQTMTVKIGRDSWTFQCLDELDSLLDRSGRKCAYDFTSAEVQLLSGGFPPKRVQVAKIRSEMWTIWKLQLFQFPLILTTGNELSMKYSDNHKFRVIY